MLGRDLSAVPIHCARLAIRGSDPTEEDRQLILEYTSISSWICEQRFGKGRFKSVPEAPGYLKTELSGRNYYVPYGLVSVFPSQQQLTSIHDLISSVRLSKESAFCLSGSGTFIGQLTCISDIDFCEYFPQAVDVLQDSVLEKMIEKPDSELIRIKIDEQIHLIPFSELLSLGKVLFEAVDRTSCSWKLDYIAKTKLFGVVATTNLVLLVDSDFTESKTLKRSFQYQEAVVLEDPSNIPKRPLIDPKDIGGYLNWLRQEASKYLGDSRALVDPEGLPTRGKLAIKALKRALSWFLMVGLSSSIGNIVNMLRRPEMDEVALASRLQEVEKLLSALDSERAAGLRVKLGAQQVLHSETRDQLKIFFDAALSLAEDLVEEIDELMGDSPELENAA